MTPLGWPVEPDVNRIFATVSGVTAPERRFDRSRGLGRGQFGEARRGAVVRHVVGDHDLDAVEIERLERAREPRAAFDEDHRRPHQVEHEFELGVVAAYQRIGRRHRRHRHTHRQRAETHRGMRQRIGRENHQRPIRPQPAIQERLADRVGLAAHRGIGDGVAIHGRGRAARTWCDPAPPPTSAADGPRYCRGTRPSDKGQRRMMVPSPRRSTSTAGGNAFTGRNGGRDASSAIVTTRPTPSLRLGPL